MSNVISSGIQGNASVTGSALGQSGTTTSSGTPTLFGPRQVQSRGRTRALTRVTPSLVEQGLRGVDPRERQRLKTRAFENIGASTKSALGGLRETFGRTGVRGGVQGADVADIIEAAIGATGAASTDIEGLLKGDAQQKLQNLVALLTSPEPFAVSTATKGLTSNKIARDLSRKFLPL